MHKTQNKVITEGIHSDPDPIPPFVIIMNLQIGYSGEEDSQAPKEENKKRKQSNLITENQGHLQPEHQQTMEQKIHGNQDPKKEEAVIQERPTTATNMVCQQVKWNSGPAQEERANHLMDQIETWKELT